MTFKKAYCYVFYKLYKSFEWVGTWGSSDYKATCIQLLLELWLLFPILTYYNIVTKRDLIAEEFQRPALIALVLLLVLVKYLVFMRKEQWKEYVKEFDSWPNDRNRIGTVVVLSVVILITSNLVFSFYLMSEIDWSKYR